MPNAENGLPVEVARSMYDARPTRDRLTIRRACYGEFAIQQEGEGRSVYLTRWGVVRLAAALLRAAFRPIPPDGTQA